MMKTTIAKKYYTVRIDAETYEAIRKVAFKTRKKIIHIIREMFVK